MRDRLKGLITICILVVLGMSLNACQRAGSTQVATLSSTAKLPTSEVTPAIVTLSPLLPSSTPVLVTITPAVQAPTAYVAPGYPLPISPATSARTQPAYPNPLVASASPTVEPASLTPSISATLETQPTGQAAAATSTQPKANPTEPAAGFSQYPSPGTQAYPIPGYPGPFYTNTPMRATQTRQPTSGPRRTTGPTQAGTKSPSPTAALTSIPITPGLAPTELPPKAPVSPPPPGSSVTIWHSWGGAETAELQSIIQAFQKIYPDVTFTLQYVPFDDLYATYEEASYLGGGPSLLLGPAKWGPGLYNELLVADLNPYFPPDFLTSVNPPALASGKYKETLISLPLSQRGMLMFRNTLIIKTAPLSFDSLEQASLQVTHGGLVGSYLERGAVFSSADILGLGGTLMDEAGYPAFNNEFGLSWMQLLADYDKAGAVTFNTNWDLEMFRRGRVGLILDGTWNISSFSQVLGAENLAIDPWPLYGTGHLSGWVEADSVFLNTNITGDNRYAALSFMGYLLDPNVQTRLAEVGHIPSVLTALPRDPLINQAMLAFMNGSAYPIGIDDNVIKLYTDELNNAIISVFVKGTPPAEALKTASDNITTQLNNIQVKP